MPATQTYDVFLSYASSDRDAVENLAQRLASEENLKVFFDQWELVPGRSFIPALGEALLAANSCAVFIGPGGVRPWHEQEIEAALARAVKSSGQQGKPEFRVIPVLLPGAAKPDDNEAGIPFFLDLRTMIEFGPKGLSDLDAFARLVAGIRGNAPRPRIPPAWLKIMPVPDLKRPTGIALDGEAIIVADWQTGQVLRIENGQVVRRVQGLSKPHHLIVMNDTIVVADTHNHQLLFFDLDFKLIAKQPKIGDDALKRPHGLASNTVDEFYLTDADNHRILRVESDSITAAAGRRDAGGKFRKGAGDGEFEVPCGVAVSEEAVYVADTNNHRVQVLARDLRFLSSFGKKGQGAGEFTYPVAVAVWEPWIVVADEKNGRLHLWRRDGKDGFTCISSDLCGDWLGSPFGVAFDHDGRLFVADRQKGQLLRIEFDRMRDALVKDAAPVGVSG